MNEYETYCIRCGKPLHSDETHFSRDDPDHEEAMCRSCCEQFEKTESEE